MKKVVFALSLCLVLSLSLSAQETLTITTYYPAPFGVYQEFRVHGRVSVGDANNDSDINNDDLAVYPAGHFTGLGGQPMPGSLSVQRAISIGGAAPRAALDVHARGDIDTAGLFSSNGYTSLGIMRGEYSHESSLVFKTSVHPSSQDWRIGVGRGANNKDLLFATGFDPGGPMSPVVITGSDGNVGIGTITPQSKLQVSGGVQIAEDNASCVAAKAGTMRYNNNEIQFCDGTDWVSAFAAQPDFNNLCYCVQVRCGTKAAGGAPSNPGPERCARFDEWTDWAEAVIPTYNSCCACTSKGASIRMRIAPCP